MGGLYYGAGGAGSALTVIGLCTRLSPSHHPSIERRGEARRERAREGERELERGRLTQDDRYALPRRRRGLQRRRLSRIHITLRLGLDRHRPLHRTVCGGSSMVSNTPLREG